MRARWRALARAHARALLASAGELVRAPFGTLLGALVLGITLALPALGALALASLARASAGLDAPPQLSVYLRMEVPDAKARALADAVRGWPQVAAVRLIPPAQALAEFRAASDMGPLLDLLDENPLPATLIVHPNAPDPAAVAALADRLRARAEVERVQADLAWVRRLHGALALGRRAVALLAVLLGAAVILVTGNTIRLAILSRREEIEIMKLVGAPDAFVRRPFLYTGLLQGLGGGAMAVALAVLARAALAGPVADLAAQYGTDFRLASLGAAGVAALLGGGGALGLAGAWLAVARHLREIEPR